MGRLTPEKGIDVLLQAAAQLPGEWRLRVIGSGPLKDTIPGRAAELGIGDRVTVEPWVPSTEVPNVIRHLDVVAVPSLTTPAWKEQFGRVLTDAMACGVPVVGSDSGEIPHVIGDGGLVTPEGDSTSLSAALARLQGDPQLRRELAARGRARVLAHFTHARIAEQTMAAYGSCSPRSAAAARGPARSRSG